MAWEALINGDELDTIDPVVRIIIDNGSRQYEFSPEQIQELILRRITTTTQGESE